MVSFLRRRIQDLPRAPIGELRKRTRILVVDDEECSFPFEILRKEGYSIDHWAEVKSLRDLEEGLYDIIILDIMGVAKEYDHNDGLGILEHLKAINPSQIVVAFSGQSFDLSKNRFWRLADDALAKPVDATMCKRLIDNLIETKMTFDHYWSGISEILAQKGVQDKQIRTLEKRIIKALKSKDPTAVKQILNSILDQADIGVRLASIGLKICALLA